MKSTFFILSLLSLAMAKKPPGNTATLARCPPQATITQAPAGVKCPNQPMCKCAAPKDKIIPCECPIATKTVAKCRTECECESIATNFVHPKGCAGDQCPPQATVTQAPEGMDCPNQPMCKCMAPVDKVIPCTCPTATVTVPKCRTNCGCDAIATNFVHPEDCRK